MAPKALKQAHGNWVVADRFWNREQEMAHLIEALREGAHVNIIAQRRIGKTSLMREAARRLSRDHLCLHIDLQDGKSPEDAIVAISKATHAHKSLWTKTQEVFGNIFGQALQRVDSLSLDEVTIKLRDGLVGGNWAEKGDRLLAEMATAEQRVFLFMDEVPVLINRMLKGSEARLTPERIAATDRFLSWMRRNAIQHRNRLSFIVAGSIGFEPILRQAGLSATINHFKPFVLEPWDAPTAIGASRRSHVRIR